MHQNDSVGSVFLWDISSLLRFYLRAEAKLAGQN